MINLNTGEISYKELPDMRTKARPANWGNCMLKWSTMDHRQGWWAYDGFVVTGEYGYIGADASKDLTLRFRLDDPSDFEYMPAPCSSLRRSVSWSPMIASCPGGLLGIGLGLSQVNLLSKIYLKENKITGIAPIVKLDGNFERTVCPIWFKVSNDIFFIGNLMVDCAHERLDPATGRSLPTVSKMKFSIDASDFALQENGWTYVSSYNDNTGKTLLYHLPPGFWTQVAKQGDLKQFEIARI